MNASDNGNWFDPDRYARGLPQQRNLGKLVGSKYGVTAYALARHRGVKNITAADIANLSFDEAVDIGFEDYYASTQIAKLQWNRVTAAVVDAGYMSGPKRAIILLQRALKIKDDGVVGPQTISIFNTQINSLGEGEVALRYCAARKEFYNYLASNQGPNDPDKKFLKGWRNRADSFLPGTSWWKAW